MVIIPGLIVAGITTAILLVYFHRRITAIEVIAPLLLSLLVGTLVKFTVEATTVTDEEFWGTWVTESTHQEDWTEWQEVDDYCTRQVYDGVDAKGRAKTRSERYICGHHTEYHYHPPEWGVKFATGDTLSVTPEHYEELRRLFGNHSQRPGHHDDYHRSTLRAGLGFHHETRWPGTETTFRPATVSKRYTNRILAANQSLFHFRTITPGEKSRFAILDYPPVANYYIQDAILGPSGSVKGAANDRLIHWNSKLGPEKQVKMFIFLFPDQPFQAGLVEQSYLQGGNKNEFILCVGTEAGRVTWAYPITWTENEDLKVKVRDMAVVGKPLDLEVLVDQMVPAIREGFRRKHFRDFDYLQVETPLWGQLLSLFLCTASNIGLAIWLVRNQYHNDDEGGSRWATRLRTRTS